MRYDVAMEKMESLSSEQIAFIARIHVFEAKLIEFGAVGPFIVQAGNDYSYMAGMELTLRTGITPVMIMDWMPTNEIWMPIKITGSPDVPKKNDPNRA